MEHAKRGTHGVANRAQAVAIGLNKAREAGVKGIPPPPGRGGRGSSSGRARKSGGAGGRKRAAARSSRRGVAGSGEEQ
jgi:hypothetical protein